MDQANIADYKSFRRPSLERYTVGELRFFTFVENICILIRLCNLLAKQIV